MSTQHEIFDRFFRALRSGERPEIRDYLDLAHEVERAELLKDLAFEEMCWRIHRDEPTSAEDLLARFPELQSAGAELRAEEARCRHLAASTMGRATPSNAAPPEAGPEILGYGPLERLDWGGMAVVYRAKNLDLGRDEAIKIPHRHLLEIDPDLARRFRAEAEAAARFSHQNVARVYRIGECPAGPFLAMELVEGAPLEEWAARPGRTVAEVAAAVAELAEAVHYVHGRGLVHRDINPRNIVVRREGERDVPVLLDFGLAKTSPTAEHAPNELAASASGTPAFMSPEQRAGRFDERTDVYGLGATLYFLLRGEPPTGTSSQPALTAGRRPALDAVYLKAVAADPADRQASARILAGDLRNALRHPRPVRRIVQSISARWSAVLTALAVAAVASWAVHRDRAGRDAAAGISAELAPVPTRTAARSSNLDVDDWRTTNEYPSAEGRPLPFARDASISRAGSGLVRRAGAGGPIVSLGNAPWASVEGRAVFGASWTRAESLGFVLRDGARPAYRFVFRALAGTGRAFQHARDRGAFVAAQIVHQGTVVREHRWRATELKDGPLELTAWRDGGQLGIRVGDLRPSLKWTDLMPMAPTDLEGNRAELGIEWPAGVALSALRVRARASTPSPGPLRSADALFRARRYGEAAEAYRRIGPGRVSSDMDAEARYKQALCLARADRPAEALEAFAAIVRSAGPPAPNGPRRDWRAPSVFQALLLIRSKGLQFPEAEGLEEILSAGPESGSDRAGGVLAQIVTEDELRQFIRDTSPYAFTTSPYHLLRIGPEQIAALERAVRALDRLDPTGASSVGPRQELLRANLSAGLYGQAQAVADELLNDRRTIDPQWRLTASRDAVWLAIEQARAPGALPETARENLNWAMEHIERGLRDPSRAGAVRAGCRPLVVEKARLLAAFGRWDEAAKALDDYLAAPEFLAPDLPREPFGSRFAPPQDVLALYYLEACLLRGFLDERKGDDRAAREVWGRGFARFRGSRAISYYEAAILGSLAGTLDGRDAELMIANTGLGAGILGAAPMLRFFSDKLGLIKDRASDVLVRAWRSDRGHRLARQIALRSLRFHESLGVQIKLWAHESFRLCVLGPRPASIGPVRELSPEQDEALWELASAMVDDYRSNRLTERHALRLVPVPMGGSAGWKAWTTLRGPSVLGAEWRGVLAYVLGCHYRNNLSDPALASRFLNDAASLAPHGSALRALVDAELRANGARASQ